MTTEIEARESECVPDLWSELDQAFGAWNLGRFEPFGPRPWGPSPPFRPARTDVLDTGAAYQIVAEVPGIPKERIDIRLRGETVEIRGDAEAAKDGEAPSAVYRERRSQSYRRLVQLPEPVVAADAKAKLENGVLTLELPKQHPSASDEVKVEVA